MRIRKPAYYDSFRCIAGDCPDSCCKEWDVEVDDRAAAYYRSLTCDFGVLLSRHLYEEEGRTYIAIENGRCPLWREDGLCTLHAALGEQALCEVCRDFPRIHHDYGSFQELGLELSCPEAARIILTASPAPAVTLEAAGGEVPQYDSGDMALLLSSREQALQLLAQPRRPLGQALALVLLYGCQIQSRLDGMEVPDFLPEEVLSSAAAMAQPGDYTEILDFFSHLEILTPRWEQLLRHPQAAPLHPMSRSLCRYFIERYWLQAVSDLDLYSRVKFAVVSCLLVSHLGGDFIAAAQLFSKEIENDSDNMDALLDGAYIAPAFRDSRILGLLLG